MAVEGALPGRLMTQRKRHDEPTEAAILDGRSATVV
jgi:hypothetical protein